MTNLLLGHNWGRWFGTIKAFTWSAAWHCHLTALPLPSAGFGFILSPSATQHIRSKPVNQGIDINIYGMLRGCKQVSHTIDAILSLHKATAEKHEWNTENDGTRRRSGSLIKNTKFCLSSQCCHQVHLQRFCHQTEIHKDNIKMLKCLRVRAADLKFTRNDQIVSSCSLNLDNKKQFSSYQESTLALHTNIQIYSSHPKRRGEQPGAGQTNV